MDEIKPTFTTGNYIIDQVIQHLLGDNGGQLIANLTQAASDYEASIDTPKLVLYLSGLPFVTNQAKNSDALVRLFSNAQSIQQAIQTNSQS